MGYKPSYLNWMNDKDISKFGEYVVTPEVEIDEVIARNTWTKLTSANKK